MGQHLSVMGQHLSVLLLAEVSVMGLAEESVCSCWQR